MKNTIRTLLFIFSILILQNSYAQENCVNGIDDDADGLIDLNDTTDCTCSGISGGGGPIPSLIPNPSFENMNCCPTTYSEVNCATDWVQASTPTSDYMNTCGIVFGAATSAGLQPFPDGNGILGTIFSPGWQEYVGACLTSPMLAGTSYTIQFNIAATPIDGFGDPCNGGVIDFGPIDITIFGTTDCANLPFNSVGCPTAGSGYDVLGLVNYNPASSWGVVSITFTPTQNINAIVLGSPCTLPADYQAPPSGCYPYFYYDNLILNNSGFFSGMSLTPSGGLCSNDASLSASIDTTGGAWQWYYEGVALVGETDSTLDVSAAGMGGGNYTALYTIGTDCIAGSYNFTSPNTPVASFTNTEPCAGQTTIFTNTSTLGTGTITDYDWDFGGGNTSILEDPTFQFSGSGSYPVTLVVTSDQGCIDSVTQNVLVNAIPNAAITYTLNCVGSPTPHFDASSVNPPSTIDSWLWIFYNGDTSTLQNPIITYPEAGEYPITLIVSANGCIDTTTATILVCDNLIVPNVFSPNGDGQNDLFIIDGLMGINNRVTIFNRWGQVVYENPDYQNNWNATGVSDGTYYYIFYTNTDQVFTGHVTVLR